MDRDDHRSSKPYFEHFGKNMVFWRLYVLHTMFSYDWVSHIFWENYCYISGKNLNRVLWLNHHISPQLLIFSMFQIFKKIRKDSDMSHDDAILYASGIVALSAFSGLIINQFFVIGFHNGMKVRVAVCSIIYRKVNIGSSRSLMINQIKSNQLFNKSIIYLKLFKGFAFVSNRIG